MTTLNSEPRQARSIEELHVAAQLLVDFNREYDDPAPEPAWLAEHLVKLTDEASTAVLITGAPACGVAVLRFRTATFVDEIEAYLAEFYIQPTLRNKGLGSQLLRFAIDHARQRGATYMDVTTTQGDEVACHMYESFGFDCHEGKGGGPLSLYYELDL